MFLPVKIREEDCDILRFLWRNNVNENPQEYRMTSLIFGAASSQNRNASQFELVYPEAYKAKRLDHYVDDFLKSFNSIKEAKHVSIQVYKIHRKAAFELRGWASNKIKVLNKMSDTQNDDNSGAIHKLKKTLDLQWDIKSDTLVLSWIRSDPWSFKPFVAHRLAEWEEHTTVKCWRWVPTKLNVADDATRDPPIDFDETHRWFRGPDFLRQNEDKWLQKIIESERPTGEERLCTTLTLVSEEVSQVVPNVSRFSRWTRLLRMAKLIMKHYVMNEIKQRYYNTSLRSKLRKIAYECQWCKINRSLPKMPSAEGDLPPERPTSSPTSFHVYGG
ncbi:hypothetical protein EVAR_65189_1 [Eumeta japonica]|uniref:Uncharacterized protein n=1 Tax=Eumeta variegata TaxID=151549 RepID=A0A4C1ZIH3_EUMVA|nr:hypothetical protein EVAR_65189_1 [Eumeta japonica]